MTTRIELRLHAKNSNTSRVELKLSVHKNIDKVKKNVPVVYLLPHEEDRMTSPLQQGNRSIFERGLTSFSVRVLTKEVNFEHRIFEQSVGICLAKRDALQIVIKYLLIIVVPKVR